MTKEISGTIGVWSPWDWQHEAFQRQLAAGEEQKAVSSLAYTNANMSDSNWVRVGTAQVKVTLDTRDSVLVRQVASLRAKQTALRAETEQECTRIEQRIQSLLAITNEAEPL